MIRSFGVLLTFRNNTEISQAHVSTNKVRVQYTFKYMCGYINHNSQVTYIFLLSDYQERLISPPLQIIFILSSAVSVASELYEMPPANCFTSKHQTSVL
jgi:hypothetical protein